MDFDREAVLASFIDEAKESLDGMEQALLGLESGASSSELLQDIFRLAHTIKGNASALDLRPLAEFTHTMEDLLDVVRQQKTTIEKDTTSLLLQAVDELRKMIPAPDQAELTRQQQRLRQKIAQEVAKRAPQVSGPVPAVEAGSDNTGRAENSPGARTLRADIARLDRMLDLTGQIVVMHGRLRRGIEKLGAEGAQEVLEIHNDAERLFMDLQEEVMRVRMVPVGPLFRQLMRTVRDLAAAHGKLARLEISGAEVEVDTTVLEHLKDPLLHMIRNSIDHGIEKPEDRERGGKDPCGTIKLSAVHSSGNLVVKLQDDGAGFDRKRIRERAQRMGLIGMGDRVSEQDLYRLVFRAGFSTAESVSDLSGRGVGLDVVKRNMDALRGSIDITSQDGMGATVAVRVPLTLAIIDGFSVRAGRDTFVIPMDYVTECTELAPEERNDAGSGVFNLRGRAVPYVRLRQAFGADSTALPRECVVVVQVENFRAGIAVDHLQGELQAVIKPLSKLFRGVTGIAGSTILCDGTVGLILDVPGLLHDLMQPDLQWQTG